MKIDLKFVHLHGPLFFNKINWGEKLDIKNTSKGKIKLTYDRAEKELLVECGKNQAILPVTSAFSMEPVDTAPEAPAPVIAPVRGKIKAQASSPMDHVFAGNGAGKTHD